MLLNSFFKICNHYRENDQVIFNIELIGDHPLYAGHFPERAIVPGVCSIGIIKECASFYLQKPLRFSTLYHCKFLKPIEPFINKSLSVMMKIEAVEASIFSIAGSITYKDSIFVLIKSKTIIL
ncbi:MAG: hypothetical protein RBS13_00245 [Bacteroidales bacterium]|jgi:3-hydroxyacyl-[acyl-carrier-protein] dehydratase|nr:hypothetical protein [Bacteroidales bacterium]